MTGDIDLVEAWRGGDRAAGELLFKRYFSTISRFFRNKFSEGVDDLVQQTFVALVEGRERLNEARSFRSYLFGIAHNVMRAHLRNMARANQFDSASSSIIELDPRPSSVCAQRQEQRLLLRALRQLTLDHQVALELVYWEGLNAAEIAEIVGVPHSTMRSRIQRARTLLREQIEALATSPELAQSTLQGLDGWAREVRAMLASA